MGIRCFGSDNFSGVLPEIFKILEEASYGHQPSYGDDIYTQKAEIEFKKIFGDNIDIYFVCSEAGANSLAITPFIESYNGVICSSSAHIYADECGSLTKQSGCTLLPVTPFNGKITIDFIKNYMKGFGNQHHIQAKLISISESTELGTVYTIKEIKEICNYAHANNMYVHMDGSRLANAVSYLNCEPKDIVLETGIDVLSLGGSRNGMMFGEAVIFFNTKFKEKIKYIRKQQMQLVTKNRFIAAQFYTILKDELWLKTAKHSNAMATLLANEAEQIPNIQITQEVQSNEVFAIIPRDKIDAIREKCFFYTWNEDASEVRWVCSFDTTENDVYELINIIRDELL